MTEVNRHSVEYVEGYYEGFVGALHAYAWWKDGKQYVGSGNYKLEEALKQALAGKKEKLEELDLLAFGVQPDPIKIRTKE